MKFIKFYIDTKSCPNICPNCGTEDSITKFGDECYCQECAYLFVK